MPCTCCACVCGCTINRVPIWKLFVGQATSGIQCMLRHVNNSLWIYIFVSSTVVDMQIHSLLNFLHVAWSTPACIAKLRHQLVVSSIQVYMKGNGYSSIFTCNSTGPDEK